MFDSWLEDLQQAAGTVAGCDPTLMNAEERAAAIKTLRATADILAGAEAGLLHAFDAQGDYREHGAPTTAAWARRELRMTAGEARTRVAAARTLAQLPTIGQASRAGKIRFEHTTALTSGIKKCGLDVVTKAQEWLLPVAEHCDAGELKDVLNTLADVVHPDRLDEAWAKGMDKQDVNLAKTSQGYHLTGFLDIVSGARFKAWLEAAAAPRDADDDRTASQRRTDALGRLFESALAHGMPTDRGVRPQINVDCDLETLLGMFAAEADSQPDTGDDGGTVGDDGVDGPGGSVGSDNAGSANGQPYAACPAELTGFGPIGPDLLSYLTCIGAFTAIITGGDTGGATPQTNVLDVGRTRRLATPKQRRAVLHRQGGICANPGCTHTHLEVHHARWYSLGGTTDLENLVGLCKRCHLLIHHHKLIVTPDGHGGFGFRRTTGKPVPDHRRTTAKAVRRRLRDLLHPTRPCPQAPPREPEPATKQPPQVAKPPPAPPTGPPPLQLRPISQIEIEYANQIARHARARPRPRTHLRT